MIGIGLWDCKDISIKGLEAIGNCNHVFLESYTSKLGCGIRDLEALYCKQITLADREMVEKNSDLILGKAKDENVAFLVMGDVFSATTHVDLKLRAMKQGILVKVIHNASVLTAIGDTGLELYKFGKVTSIPFENENVKSPVDVFNMNSSNGLHTLFLLDLHPIEKKYMSAYDASQYLLKHIEDMEVIACAGLGSDKPLIVYKKLSEIPSLEIFPQCLIIPSKLHFMEEEALKSFK